MSDATRGCTTCPLHPPGAGPADPTRRAFLSQALVASVGAWLAACGDGNIGGVTGPGGSGPPPLPGPLVVTIANHPALANNGGIATVQGGFTAPIAAVRINATTYLAFSLICPHAGFRPITGINGVGFSCPNHGAQFELDGDWSGGQPTRDLRSYDVVFDAGAGTLTIG